MKLRARGSSHHVLVFGSEWTGEAAGLNLFLSDGHSEQQVRKKTNKGFQEVTVVTHFNKDYSILAFMIVKKIVFHS